MARRRRGRPAGEPGAKAELGEPRLSGRRIDQEARGSETPVNELPPMELGQHRAEPDRKIEEEVEVPPGGGRQRVERHTAGVLHHERAALAVAEKLARSRDARHREIAHQLPLTLEPPGAERGFAVRRLQQDSQPIREAPGAVKRTPLVDEQGLSDVVTRNAHAWRRRSLLSPDPAREICRETVGHAALGYEQVGSLKVEGVGGRLQNTVIYTYPMVSQFWRYAPRGSSSGPGLARLRPIPPPSSHRANRFDLRRNPDRLKPRPNLIDSGLGGLSRCDAYSGSSRSPRSSWSGPLCEGPRRRAPTSPKSSGSRPFPTRTPTSCSGSTRPSPTTSPASSP